MIRLLTTLALILAAGGASADRIVLRADPWCPYNCAPGSERPGFMVEIAREALAPYGHEVVYENAPWSRALAQAQSGEIAGAIGAAPEEAPDLLFGPPLGLFQEAAAFRAGERIDFADPAALAALRIGTIRGYDYDPPLGPVVAANRGDATLVQEMGGEAPLQANLRKLTGGRIDVIPDVAAVLEAAVHEAGLTDRVEVRTFTTGDHVFIAFTRAHPRAATWNAQLAEGVGRLRASGRMDQIMARYGLSDWE
ncbi:MAG: substrate-binding periplasmic protein [Hasllibacter sp.]